MPVEYLGNIKGPRGTSVASAKVSSDDRLRMVFDDGTQVDAGNVRGPQGLPGTNGVPTDDAVAALTKLPSKTRTALESAFGTVLDSPGERVDFVPLVQDLADRGIRHIRLVSGKTYWWASLLFLDSPSVRAGFVIDMNGANVIIAQGTGAKASDFAGDPLTRFLIFVNTKRSAYNAATNTVTTSEDTCATGRFTATVGPGLIINEADIRSETPATPSTGGDNIKVAYLNNTSMRISGRLSYIHGNWGTRGYCDSNYSTVRLTNPVPNTADTPAIVDQRSNGDNLVVLGNSDARGLTANLRFTRGAIFEAPVAGGFVIRDSAAVVIHGGHIEGDEGTRRAAPVTINNSDVAIRDSEFWAGNTSKPFAGSVVVADSTSSPDAFTTLTIDSTEFHSVYRAESFADERQTADLYISSMNVNSRITVRQSFGVTRRVADLYGFRIGMRVAVATSSDNAGIQAAIDNGGDLIAAGTWELRQVSGTWRVVHPDRPYLALCLGSTTQPSVDVVGQPSASDTVLAALTAGSYSYVFASIDAFGVYSNRTSASTLTVGDTTRAVRAIVRTVGDRRLAIWRKPPGAAAGDAGYTDYIEIGVMGRKVFLYDTGQNMNRRPWRSDNVPALPGTTGSASVDGVRFNGTAH